MNQKKQFHIILSNKQATSTNFRKKNTGDNIQKKRDKQMRQLDKRTLSMIKNLKEQDIGQKIGYIYT